MNENINNEESGYKSFYITLKLADGFILSDFEQSENTRSINNAIFPWYKIIEIFPGLRINKLFTSLTIEQITQLTERARKSDPTYHPRNLFSYYYILCPADIKPNDVILLLEKTQGIELAYLHGRIQNTSALEEKEIVSFTHRYLNPAPEGINAKYAWGVQGGKGDGKVKFIDIEQGWVTDDHENINIRTFPLSGNSNNKFKDHGIAVFSIIMMKANEDGAAGIAPEANGYAISQWRLDGLPNEADAILTAISYLDFGDIILLESQSFHADTKDKLWPVEIQDAIFEVTRLATALGIIVIEPSGNGDLYYGSGNNLDLFVDKGKRVLYPGCSDFRDSGAILVAAAYQHLPHTKINSSNYGNRINCYASGEPSGGFPQKINATSGASAIIAGVVISIQSICEAVYSTRLGPMQMRVVLSSENYGTISENGHAIDKIGVMPDLKKIINTYLDTRPDKI